MTMSLKSPLFKILTLGQLFKISVLGQLLHAERVGLGSNTNLWNNWMCGELASYG
jgi:hypothetical protein